LAVNAALVARWIEKPVLLLLATCSQFSVTLAQAPCRVAVAVTLAGAGGTAGMATSLLVEKSTERPPAFTAHTR
jgi:hypothetical protein